MKITDIFIIPRGIVLEATLDPDETSFVGQVVEYDGKNFLVMEQGGFHSNCFTLNEYKCRDVGLLVVELTQEQVQTYQDYKCVAGIDSFTEFKKTMGLYDPS